MNHMRKADHWESCSGGEHSAAKRGRKEDHFSQSSSGGAHSAEPFTILFADIGQYDRALRPVLIFDPRPTVQPSEVQEYADEFEADVAVYPSAVSADGVEWNVLLNKSTHSMPREIRLGPRHTAQSTILRRNTPGTEKIELILVRILKGKTPSFDVFCGPHVEHDLHYTPHDRKEVAFALFDLLLEATRPMAILGNPGFSLSAIATLTREYQNEIGHDISQHVQCLLSRDQQLMCLHTGGETMQNAKRVDATEPYRILIITSRSAHSAVTDEGPTSTGSAHSAATDEGPTSSGSAHSAVTNAEPASSGSAHSADAAAI